MPTFRYETQPTAPSTPADLQQAFLRLGALAGAEPAAVLACAPAGKQGERDQFAAWLHAARPLLKPLASERAGSLLGRFLRDERFDGEVSSRALPKEAKKALKAGEVVASSDAEVWIWVEGKDGRVEVSHAHPESFEVLGESLAEWLLAEAAAIEAARRPAKRARPGTTGKAAIDASLARLVELSGGADVSAALAGLPHAKNDTLWKYLMAALPRCGASWSPALLSALDGRLLGRLLTGRMHDTDDETCVVDEDDDDLDGINPVYVNRYPKEARKAIDLVKPTNFVASSGPELWFILWEAKGAAMSWPISVHHAAWNGYEVLSPTLEGWLDAEVRRLESILAP